MDDLLINSIYAGVIVAVVLVITGLLNRAVTNFADRGKIPQSLISPIQIVIRWGLFVVAFLLILSAYDIRIGNIWTLVSTVMAMIAIGFVAVWSLLSNMSATLLIVVFRPFQIGDYVEFVGEETNGVVKRTGLMFTTLQNDDGHLLQIPNNLFFQRILKRKKHPDATPVEDTLTTP